MKIINLKYDYKNFYLIVFFVVFGLFLTSELVYSQNNSSKKKKKSKVYPDEYSALDEGNKKYSFEAEFQDILEESRQKYFQGLILIQKKDTIGAAKYFEQALDKMNMLASYPGVDENIEFTELAQSILEDYELYITNTEYLDPDSPLMIIKQVMYKEIESLTPATPGKDVATITPNTHTIPQKTPFTKSKLVLPPDSIVIPLTSHPDVDKNIDFFTGKLGRKFFTRWLERSTKYFPMMKRIAENEGLPLEIIYVSMFESGLKPDAVSRAGAVGLWQFMRSTGELYNLNGRPSYWLDERRDPDKATRAAMRHFKDLYREFGDWQIALAAYNRGAGGVSRSMKKVKKENINYWDFRQHLPKETRQYVPSFIAIVKILNNLEGYGFNLDSLKFHQEYDYDIFELREPVNIYALAKAANITVDEFRELNPELIKGSTPPDRVPYYIKIPKGSNIRFGGLFASLTKEEKNPFIEHTVRKKEKISSIAKLYKVNKEEIAVINDVNLSKLEEGQVIKIPLSQQDFAALNININNIPIVDVTESEVSKSKPSNSNNNLDVKNITHKVQTGETLFSIARHYGMDVALLRKYNNLNYDNERIIVGQELIIAKRPIDEINDEESDNGDYSSEIKRKEKIITHKVKSGESLMKIANKYNVSTANIKELNKLKSDKLKKNQILKIRVTDHSSDKNITKNTGNSKVNKSGVHKVKQGETLSDIATQYDITVEQLKEWNKDEISGNTVFADSRLKVSPTSNVVTKNDKNSKKESNIDSKSSKKSKTYTVKSGDTLSSIAKRNGLTLAQIMKLNKNVKENSLQIGQKIKLN